MARPCTIQGAAPKAACSCIVPMWALKGLPYHNFGAYVYTIMLLIGACGCLFLVPMGIKLAQSRYYLHALGPNAGIIYILG